MRRLLYCVAHPLTGRYIFKEYSLHSLIIHRIDKERPRWKVKAHKPFSHFDEYLFNITYTQSEGLDFRSNIYQEHIFHEILKTGKNIASDSLSLPQSEFDAILALKGGFWYRFKSNMDNFSTYVRKSQNIVILSVGGNVVTVIFDDNLQFDEPEPHYCPCASLGSRGFPGQVYSFMTQPGHRARAINEIKSYTEYGKYITVIDPYILGNITGKCEINDKFINVAKKKNIDASIIDFLTREKGRSFRSVEKLMNYLGRAKSITISKNNNSCLLNIASEQFIPNSYVSDFMKSMSQSCVKHVNLLYSSSHSDDKKIKDEIINKLGSKVKFYDLDTFDDVFIHDRVWVVDSKDAVVVGNSFGGLGMDAISFILPLPRKDLESLKKVLSPHGIKI